jgi:hypothetical protein
MPVVGYLLVLLVAAIIACACKVASFGERKLVGKAYEHGTGGGKLLLHMRFLLSVRFC